MRLRTLEASPCHAQAQCTLKVRHTIVFFTSSTHNFYCCNFVKNAKLVVGFCFGSNPSYILTTVLHSQPHKYNHRSPKAQKAPSREKINTCCWYNAYIYMWFLCAVRPDSPQDVKVHHVSDLNITLTWSPGFTGHSQLSTCTIQVEYTCYYIVFDIVACLFLLMSSCLSYCHTFLVDPKMKIIYSPSCYSKPYDFPPV